MSGDARLVAPVRYIDPPSMRAGQDLRTRPVPQFTMEARCRGAEKGESPHLGRVFDPGRRQTLRGACQNSRYSHNGGRVGHRRHQCLQPLIGLCNFATNFCPRKIQFREFTAWSIQFQKAVMQVHSTVFARCKTYDLLCSARQRGALYFLGLT